MRKENTHKPPPQDTWIFPSGRKLKLPGHEVAPLLSIAHRSLGTAAALSESETKAPAVMHYLPCRQHEPKLKSPPGGGSAPARGGNPSPKPIWENSPKEEPSSSHSRPLGWGEQPGYTGQREKTSRGSPRFGFPLEHTWQSCRYLQNPPRQ